MSPTMPCSLDRALEEGGLDAGVVDPFADLAHEQLGDRVHAAVGEEVRQLEERVHAGGDDEVEVDLGIDPLEARDVAAEAVRGRVDDRLDAGRADGAQLLDRIRDAHVLVPVARAPHVPEVLERLRLEDEHVLVHQRSAQRRDVDRAAHRLDRAHPAILRLGRRPILIGGAMVTADDVCAFARTLPRTNEGLVRGQVKFRIGRIVYLALSRDGSTMGFAFPKELREALIESEPEKFSLPRQSDMRYHWVHVRLDAIDADEMHELVEDAWAFTVPKSVIEEYLAVRSDRAAVPRSPSTPAAARRP